MAWTFNSSCLITSSFLGKTLYKPVLNLPTTLGLYFIFLFILYFFLSNIYCSPYVNICKYKSQAPICFAWFSCQTFLFKKLQYTVCIMYTGVIHMLYICIESYSFARKRFTRRISKNKHKIQLCKDRLVLQWPKTNVLRYFDGSFIH